MYLIRLKKFDDLNSIAKDYKETTEKFICKITDEELKNKALAQLFFNLAVIKQGAKAPDLQHYID